MVFGSLWSTDGSLWCSRSVCSCSLWEYWCCSVFGNVMDYKNVDKPSCLYPHTILSPELLSCEYPQYAFIKLLLYAGGHLLGTPTHTLPLPVYMSLHLILFLSLAMIKSAPSVMCCQGLQQRIKSDTDRDVERSQSRRSRDDTACGMALIPSQLFTKPPNTNVSLWNNAN